MTSNMGQATESVRRAALAQKAAERRIRDEGRTMTPVEMELYSAVGYLLAGIKGLMEENRRLYTGGQ